MFPSFLSLGIFFNTSSNDFMNSFSFMVTSFRVCFIELKIKRQYFSLCLLMKENKITSEGLHFSKVPSILLCYLVPSAFMYSDNCAWNQGTHWCDLGSFLCSRRSFHNIAFQGIDHQKFVKLITKPMGISCGFIHPI